MKQTAIDLNTLGAIDSDSVAYNCYISEKGIQAAPKELVDGLIYDGLGQYHGSAFMGGVTYFLFDNFVINENLEKVECRFIHYNKTATSKNIVTQQNVPLNFWSENVSYNSDRPIKAISYLTLTDPELKTFWLNENAATIDSFGVWLNTLGIISCNVVFFKESENDVLTFIKQPTFFTSMPKEVQLLSSLGIYAYRAHTLGTNNPEAAIITGNFEGSSQVDTALNLFQETWYLYDKQTRNVVAYLNTYQKPYFVPTSNGLGVLLPFPENTQMPTGTAGLKIYRQDLWVNNLQSNNPDIDLTNDLPNNGEWAGIQFSSQEIYVGDWTWPPPNDGRAILFGNRGWSPSADVYLKVVDMNGVVTYQELDYYTEGSYYLDMYRWTGQGEPSNGAGWRLPNNSFKRYTTPAGNVNTPYIYHSTTFTDICFLNIGLDDLNNIDPALPISIDTTNSNIASSANTISTAIGNNYFAHPNWYKFNEATNNIDAIINSHNTNILSSRTINSVQQTEIDDLRKRNFIFAFETLNSEQSEMNVEIENSQTFTGSYLWAQRSRMFSLNVERKNDVVENTFYDMSQAITPIKLNSENLQWNDIEGVNSTQVSNLIYGDLLLFNDITTTATNTQSGDTLWSEQGQFLRPIIDVSKFIEEIPPDYENAIYFSQIGNLHIETIDFPYFVPSNISDKIIGVWGQDRDIYAISEKSVELFNIADIAVNPISFNRVFKIYEYLIDWLGLNNRLDVLHKDFNSTFFNDVQRLKNFFDVNARIYPDTTYKRENFRVVKCNENENSFFVLVNENEQQFKIDIDRPVHSITNAKNNIESFVANENRLCKVEYDIGNNEFFSVEWFYRNSENSLLRSIDIYTSNYSENEAREFREYRIYLNDILERSRFEDEKEVHFYKLGRNMSNKIKLELQGYLKEVIITDTREKQKHGV